MSEALRLVRDIAHAQTASITSISLPGVRTMFRQPLILDLARLDGHEGVRVVSAEITRWMMLDKRNNQLKVLARKAGLSVHTVSRIASRETFMPRLTTIVLILHALGFSAVRFD